MGDEIKSCFSCQLAKIFSPIGMGYLFFWHGKLNPEWSILWYCIGASSLALGANNIYEMIWPPDTSKYDENEQLP